MQNGAAREIPYKSDEVHCNSPERQSNMRSFPAYDDGRQVKKGSHSSSSATSTEERPPLSLIPLHPASKKQAAKQLPIVLGRTNLAAWWWKSCSCQNYCRLHCRPVAQNIRSLSKVMIQIDTAGRFNIVGKNPHLIVITPEREDNILRENDVISVGRRDREPWMRFQAIRKPTGKEVVPAGASRRRTAAAPLETANVQRHTNNRRNSKAIKPSAPSPSNPPEWITTNTQKRKSDQCSKSIPSQSKLAQAPHEEAMSQPPAAQEAIFQPPTFQGAASVPTIARSHRFDVRTSQQAAKTEGSFESPRKRRRRGVPAEGNIGNDTKSRRSNRGGRKANDVDIINRTMGGNTANTNGGNIGRDHSHFHLVFQDYQTSALLLQGNEIRRKSESNINQGTAKASRAESVVRSQQHGLGAPSRALVAATSQLSLLSRNFADALLGAVPPIACEEVTTKMQGESTVEKRAKEGSEKSSAAGVETVSPATRNVLSTLTSKKPEDRPQSIDSKDLLDTNIGVTDKQYEEEQDFPQSIDSKDLLDTNIGVTDKHCEEERPKVDEDDETASVLSVPECGSSLIEAGQKIDCPGIGETMVHSDSPCRLFVAGKVDDVQELPGDEASSASSRPSWDQFWISNLGRI